MSSNLPIIPSPSTYCRPDVVLGFLASGLPDHIAVDALSEGPCVLGFACGTEARHDNRPNRVHLRYGLIVHVHLRLLSTSPRGDAVTFSYEVPEHFGKDLHPADSMHLQAHTPTVLRGNESREQIGSKEGDYSRLLADPHHDFDVSPNGRAS